MTSPDICATCHEFTLPNGVKVEGTYSQWMDGLYGGETNFTCQKCHMTGRAGKSTNLPTSPRRPEIHSHAFRGGDSQNQLRRALKVSMRKLGRNRVETEVENRGAGHNVPGNAHGLRELELVVTANDARGIKIFDRTFDRTFVYAKRYADRRGRRTLFYWEAASIASDNTIPAGSSKKERISLPAGAVSATASLYYRRFPQELVERFGWQRERAYRPRPVNRARVRF